MDITGIRIKIALETLKMPDVLVEVMGGMSKAEAQEYLLKHGFSIEDAFKTETGSL